MRSEKVKEAFYLSLFHNDDVVFFFLKLKTTLFRRSSNDPFFQTVVGGELVTFVRVTRDLSSTPRLKTP